MSTYDGYEKALKDRKKTALFQTIRYFLIYLVISCFIIWLLSYLLPFALPVFQKKYMYYAASVIIFYLIVQAIKNYKKLTLYLEIMMEIRKIKRESSNVLDSLNYYYRNYERKTEESKIRLDLLKSFSPVPLIVFLLTFIQGTNFAVLADMKNLKTFSFPDQQEFLALSVVLFVAGYAVTILNSYSLFKKVNGVKYHFYIALEKEMRAEKTVEEIEEVEKGMVSHSWRNQQNKREIEKN